MMTTKSRFPFMTLWTSGLQERVQNFSLGQRPKGRRLRAGDGFFGRGSNHSQPARGSREALGAPQRGSDQAPTAQRFFNMFSTQDGLSWHYNIVNTEGLRERTEHLDIFLFLNGVLFPIFCLGPTGGKGVSDFSVLKILLIEIIIRLMYWANVYVF